jgi:hypothetical protein
MSPENQIIANMTAVELHLFTMQAPPIARSSRFVPLQSGPLCRNADRNCGNLPPINRAS